MTPLHCAAHNGRLEAVQLLLRHGADKELKDKHGSKPVDVRVGFRRWQQAAHLAAIAALLR